MKFETTTRVGGSLIKGHLLKKESAYGGYDSHQGFIGVHWEVQEKYPNRVYLQVEAPRHKTCRTLNRIKENIIKDLLTSNIPIIAKENGLTLNPGSKSGETNIRTNKSTGVFSIDFIDELEPKIMIIKVHKILGDLVEKEIEKYNKEIERILS